MLGWDIIPGPSPLGHQCTTLHYDLRILIGMSRYSPQIDSAWHGFQYIFRGDSLFLYSWGMLWVCICLNTHIDTSSWTPMDTRRRPGLNRPSRGTGVVLFVFFFFFSGCLKGDTKYKRRPSCFSTFRAFPVLSAECLFPYRLACPIDSLATADAPSAYHRPPA